MGKLTDQVFNESCCDGGACNTNESTQYCGCDMGHKPPHYCERHRKEQEALSQFVVKDTGNKMQFESGMLRNASEDKIDYSLALDGPMFKRLAVHLTKGAKIYAKRNWMKAEGQAELDRFKESALRHFLQWYWDVTDEDHAAAILFNVNGAEYVKEKMK